MKSIQFLLLSLLNIPLIYRTGSTKRVRWVWIHTHPFNGHFSGTTRVSRYQKGKTNLDFTEARDSEWQWHQLGHMQVCTSLHTDNHASTPPLSFLQAGCPSCRPTNSVKALKARRWVWIWVHECAVAHLAVDSDSEEKDKEQCRPDWWARHAGNGRRVDNKHQARTCTYHNHMHVSSHASLTWTFYTLHTHTHTHTHTPAFNCPLSGTAWYEKKHSPTHTHEEEEGFAQTQGLL